VRPVTFVLWGGGIAVYGAILIAGLTWACRLTARCWPTPFTPRYALRAARQNADV